MSMHSFHEIPVGASQEEVIAAVGKPYAVHQLPNGEVEYEYIESLKIGAQDVNERHYFLLLKDGRVVSKRIKQEAPAGYTIDSYDMQTTQTGKATPSAEK